MKIEVFQSVFTDLFKTDKNNENKFMQSKQTVQVLYLSIFTQSQLLSCSVSFCSNFTINSQCRVLTKTKDKSSRSVHNTEWDPHHKQVCEQKSVADAKSSTAKQCKLFYHCCVHNKCRTKCKVDNNADFCLLTPSTPIFTRYLCICA